MHVPSPSARREKKKLKITGVENYDFIVVGSEK